MAGVIAQRNVNWLRLIRDVLYIAGIAFAVVFWLYYQGGGEPSDAHAYWVADPQHLYPHLELARDGYYYTPAFELFVSWTRVIPFEVFVALYRAILLAAVVYMAGPFTLFVLLTNPVGSEINAGNIQILMALAIVWGFRHPWTWAFVLVTKVTPGVGLIWFAVRREWRNLAIVGAATAALVGASLLLSGGQWPAYIALISQGAAPAAKPYYLTLFDRLPWAIALVTVGALGNWKWTVPAAACLALPVFYPISWSLMLGCLPFIRITIGRLLAERGYSLERAVPNPAGPPGSDGPTQPTSITAPGPG
jgi:hypothetical protein